ncbi:hypothetical protein Barb6_02111 [Bacteroidales bacterium Barb6]|nr:hypothetical protein Barb6_02111 [Bacteroidales bacterium Barb6]
MGKQCRRKLQRCRHDQRRDDDPFHLPRRCCLDTSLSQYQYRQRCNRKRRSGRRGSVIGGRSPLLPCLRLFCVGSDLRRSAARFGCRQPEIQHHAGERINAQHCARSLYDRHIPRPAHSGKRPSRQPPYHWCCHEDACPSLSLKGVSDLRMVAGKPEQYPYLSRSSENRPRRA